MGLPVFVGAALVLSWLAFADAGFRDSGEIGAAAFELGVAHPTGFPGDLLLLRAASFLPVGSIAWRQNLCVALQAAALLAVLSCLCVELVQRVKLGDVSAARAGALIAVTGLLGWQTFLGAALAVEVYALSLLYLACVALLLARGGLRNLALAALLVGLSAGSHVTAAAWGAALLGCAVLGHAKHAGLRHVVVLLPIAAIGALVLLYLPLASARQPALDWGDPETFGRLLEHLTAARIRSAYGGEMLSAHAPGAQLVLEQVAELWPLAIPAALGLLLGLRREPLVVLAPMALLSIDLAYGMYVNPMGAIDRQVGHVAGAALGLLASLGTAAVVARAQTSGRRTLAWLVTAAAALWLVQRAPQRELADEHAAVELFGSGGPLASVPPRAVVLCRTDDACAGGLFALLVDAIRPDVDVVPAQHLWDPTVLRRLEGISPAGAEKEPEVNQRARVVERVLRKLVLEQDARPVLAASTDPLRELGPAALRRHSVAVPYLVLGTGGAALAPRVAIARLDRIRAARGGRFRSTRAQHAWSQAYDLLGEQALASDLQVAERAFRTGVELAPRRAAAVTNLGVVLERSARLEEAAAQYRRALQLDPLRPTPWINLARLEARVGGPAAGLAVVKLAKHAGVSDPRLGELEAALRRAAAHP
jgi:hypothetical protein